MSVETLAARAKTRALEQQVLRLKGRVSELVGERNAAERAAEMRGLHAQCARELVGERNAAERAAEMRGLHAQCARELVGERNAAERAAEMRGLHAQCAREPTPVVAAKRSPADRRTAAAVALSCGQRKREVYE
jgi:hypothetical protein